MIRTLEVIAFAGGLYAAFRGWVWVCDHVLLRNQEPLATAPGLPDDGKPLSPAEKQRLGWIEDGYGQTAREPGRSR